jgi:hypothetical protein
MSFAKRGSCNLGGGKGLNAIDYNESLRGTSSSLGVRQELDYFDQ